MTDTPVDLDVLDEHGATLHDEAKTSRPKPVIFDAPSGMYGAWVGRQLIQHPDRKVLEQKLGLVTSEQDRLDAEQRAEAERQAAVRAEAEEALPELRERHKAARQVSADKLAEFRQAVRDWTDVPAAFVALLRAESHESRRSHRVRVAEFQLSHGHGNGAPSLVMSHRWHRLSEALDAFTVELEAEAREAERQP